MSKHHARAATAVALFLSALGALAGAACAPADDGAVGASDEALTAEQCSYFASGDKVTICHHTGAARKPYSIIRTNVASCGGHADHAGDYIASADPASPLYDPTCSGQGCLPEGAPTDGTIECCDGLADAGGVCAPTALRIVDVTITAGGQTWRASGGCDGAFKLFTYAYGPGTLLNPGPHQGLSDPIGIPEGWVTGINSYLFSGTAYAGGVATVEVTLSDGHTLSATGDIYGNAPAPAVVIGDRSYRIVLFEALSHGEDGVSCGTAGSDGLIDLIGDLEVEVTDLSAP